MTTALDCSIYWETSWGTDINQLGYNSDVEGNPGPFFPPTFSETGELYIADRFNQRILIPSKGEVIESISAPSMWPQDGADDIGRRWSNLAVRRGNLYLRFSEWMEDRVVDNLAIFTFDSQRWDIISLASYYPQHSNVLHTITVDGSGGVYVRLDPGMVYFDKHHNPGLVLPGLEMDEMLLLGWDNNLYLYAYRFDKLTVWNGQQHPFRGWAQPIYQQSGMLSFLGSRNDKQLPLYRHLLGTDIGGQIYMAHSSSDAQKSWIIIKLASNEQVLVGEIPSYILSTFTKLSLAPDGGIYGITYDPKSASTLPRIIQCYFSVS